jgi:hypothetical protein
MNLAAGTLDDEYLRFNFRQHAYLRKLELPYYIAASSDLWGRPCDDLHGTSRLQMKLPP